MNWQALLEAEDEQDVCAATKAKAEEAAELAEFDEGIPYCDEASKVHVLGTLRPCLHLVVYWSKWVTEPS